MPELAEIYVYPIKSLEPTSLETVSISEIGGLAHDREYAMVDDDGTYVIGKRTTDVHRLHTDFGPDLETLDIGVRNEAPESFHLVDDREELEAWLSDYFGYSVTLQRAEGGRYTDGGVYGEDLRPGPTLISRGTIREAASWFDGITPDEMRRRLRPNLVIDGVEPFWEDRLLTDGGVQFTVGTQELHGVEPIARCAVPARDPDTGAERDGFRTTFIEKRKETLPEWVDESAFDHFFSLMIAVGIPVGAATGLAVGDEVVVAEPIDS